MQKQSLKDSSHRRVASGINDVELSLNVNGVHPPQATRLPPINLHPQLQQTSMFPSSQDAGQHRMSQLGANQRHSRASLNLLGTTTAAKHDEERKSSSFIASQGGHFNLAQATVGGRADHSLMQHPVVGSTTTQAKSPFSNTQVQQSLSKVTPATMQQDPVAAAQIQQSRGSIRHTVNAHTLQHVLSGAAVSKNPPTRQQLQKQAQASRMAAEDKMQSMQATAAASVHSAGIAQRDPNNMRHRIGLPQGSNQQLRPKKKGTSVNRQGGGTLGPRLSDLSLQQTQSSSNQPNRHSKTESAVNLAAMIESLRQRPEVAADKTLANSFKFNPAVIERNAFQVSSTRALPQATGQQRPRVISNDLGITIPNSRQTLAPLAQQSQTNVPQAIASELLQKKSKTTKSKPKNNLEEQIARNLMPNFQIPVPIATAEPVQSVDQGVQPFLTVVPQSSNSLSPPGLDIIPIEEPAAAEEESKTMVSHLQNMASFNSARSSNRRGELPLHSLSRPAQVFKPTLPTQVSEAQAMSTSLVNPNDLLTPLEEPQGPSLDAAATDEVGTPAEVNIRKAKLAVGKVTAEKGCGPDNEGEEEVKQASDKPFEEERKEGIVLAASGTTNQQEAGEEDKDGAESSEVDSELAETLIQKTYVEKKADRLIKEFQTASDDEEQIQKVKSAVKQIQLEEGEGEGDNNHLGLLEDEQEDELDQIRTESEEHSKSDDVVGTPQPADKQLQESGLESQGSSSHSGLGAAAQNDQNGLQQQSNSLNVKKSLLTSTGCGPDGSRTADLPKIAGGQKIKLKRKADQTAHIHKFSSSMVFSAIERVTKAGSELIVRPQDPENPVQQLNQNKILYDFDSEQGLEACRKYLECLENLFALSFLKRASREYRQHFTAAYRVLYDNPVASPLNYLVEILDSAQESFPYLWVNGKKYEFSQVVLQQGNMMYATFSDLKEAISQLHLSVVTAKATMSSEFCQLAPEELLRHRTRVERLLEQFDQDWSIYEKAYVTELMAIEADARRHVTEAIRIVQQMCGYESEQRLRGRILNAVTDEEYNCQRNKFLRQICEINTVANSIGQGRDDLDVSVLIVADEVSRKVSASQSVAVRQLCTHIQRSFTNLKNLFVERYAENVEVVDPQLRNNPELVHLVARFEKAWCLGRTHIVPRDEREQLISFSQLIEGTCEKYSQFKEQVECSDAEIFITIPNLLVLKSSLDTGKEAQIATSVCQRFFPVMFQKPEASQAEDPTNIFFKFQQLKADLEVQRIEAGAAFFDFYNMIEQQILFGTTQTPAQHASCSSKTADLDQGVTKKRFKLCESQAGVIKEIGMSMTRQQPTEWNEFMIVALGIPEDEPLPFMQQDASGSQAENQDDTQNAAQQPAQAQSQSQANAD